MILTVFRSRLNPEAEEDYFKQAASISALAKTQPGYRSHKVFVAEDGERLTLVEFEDKAAQQNWAQHTEHRAAQEQGRASYYQEYSLQICEVVRESRFPR